MDKESHLAWAWPASDKPGSREPSAGRVLLPTEGRLELELELIQSHMTQKPMLRGEVGARALRVRSEVRGDGHVRLCNALGCGGRGCLKPIRRVVLWSQLS